MKIVCVADAYVTKEMMMDGIKPYCQNDDVTFLFFGKTDRMEMRDTVKAIEAMKINEIHLPLELENEICDADIVIVHLCPITKYLIDKAKKLKAILSCRGGVENIDVNEATKKNIIVTTNPAHNANAVAEFTIGLILSETRNIARSNIALKNGKWREIYPNTTTAIRELHDMTIGIVGFGSVGRLVAEKLSSFGCNIVVFDPYVGESAFDFINYKFISLEALLKMSDVVTLHARTANYIIGEKEFEIMKPNSYLINTARSNLVDPNALKNALEKKLILGAAIDVFESEPNIPSFYKEYDNITITNHRGGDTINSYKDSPSFAIKNYLKYLQGENLRFWVNKNSIKK